MTEIKKVPKSYIKKDVLKIKELIEILKQYPEDGEVWLEGGWCTSNECVEVSPLDVGDDGFCDVLLGRRKDL